MLFWSENLVQIKLTKPFDKNTRTHLDNTPTKNTRTNPDNTPIHVLYTHDSLINLRKLVNETELNYYNL